MRRSLGVRHNEWGLIEGVVLATLHGEIWLDEGEASRFALHQIRLLQAIEDTGSISAAAKQSGISYKTAWDRLERLNNLSREPLVSRSAGGSKGGGTQLTEYGQNIVKGFMQLEEQHRLFLENLNTQLSSLDDISGFMKHSLLQASARNQFLGEVVSVEVNTEVIIQISDTLNLVAVITEHSRQEMEIEPGTSVIALIKASSVTVSTDTTLMVSARNKLVGHISRIEQGRVNSELSIDLGGSKTVSALVTNNSVDRLALEQSTQVCAFWKASSVILLRA
jgi:molybdate transport system regulatory protein